MKRHVPVIGEKELEHITRQLHDLWFDVSDVRYDRKRGTVTVPFLNEKQPPRSRLSDTTAIDRWLDIRDVEQCQLRESEGVERYDFNELRYSPEARVLRVATGIPLTFELIVAALNLAVRQESSVSET